MSSFPTRAYNQSGYSHNHFPKVPDILLSGDHEKIRKYRLRDSIKNTLQKRPDLLKNKILNDEEKDILKDLLEGGKDNGLY